MSWKSEPDADRQPLRVGIDARIPTGRIGGVEQLLIGMASGLSRLSDGGDCYCFLTLEGQDDWIRPYLTGPCLPIRSPAAPARMRRLVGRWEKPIRTALGWFGELAVTLPRSDGTAERAGCDLMHQTLEGFVTDIPTLFQLNDLQHVHLPEFFTRRDRSIRNKRYPAFSQQAAAVVTLGHHGRSDIISTIGLPGTKVFALPLGSSLQIYRTPTLAEDARVRRTFGLPARYLLYPAQTWPHKNHVRLVEAIAVAKTELGLRIPVVLSGRLNEHHEAIRARASQLGVTDQIVTVGFVTPEELKSLYRMAYGVVFPSLFEGWGMPVSEAFDSGVPVACSAVTSLPEVAGDAAILFNPHDPRDIAFAMRTLWTDESLRARLVAKGTERARTLTWQHTAKILRALYRKTANRFLSSEDASLLAQSCPAEMNDAPSGNVHSEAH
jgi:glycosyltransferase involved in cell wall biosynthesis